ncbi:hypothetical protein ACFV4P_34445 [Kitasatospora sp. NPDC059795]|uniref:hypothetical protein n=1 Tax=Kitasatospora sp. NPDC059795 TaxID=3346949 RepID=UPI0036641417
MYRPRRRKPDHSALIRQAIREMRTGAYNRAVGNPGTADLRLYLARVHGVDITEQQAAEALQSI